MVSQRHRTIGSRDRLIRAATEEFSARGFDGAKVDRIAAKAGVNKAMLYYHFDDKAALYREILRDLFESLAVQLAHGLPREATPEQQVQRFVRIVAGETAARPYYPSIWLREMAEGGRHVDASILKPIGTILKVLADILRDGHRRGVFRRAHPVVVQMGIVAPLLLFAASAPTRERLTHLVPGGATGIGREAVVAHVETATLAALKATAAKRARCPPSRRGTR